MPYIISIDGLIAAGKTSILKSLSKDFKCFLEPIEKWTLLTHMYDDSRRYGSALQFQILVSQIEQTVEINRNDDDIVLVERSPWASRYIFSPQFLDEKSLSVYDEMYRSLTYSADATIYLRTEPEIAFSRIADPRISLEYLKKLHALYELEISATVVDASQPLEDVEKDVRCILENTRRFLL